MELTETGEYMATRFEAAGKRLGRTLKRSTRLRMLSLGVLNAMGCLLMLAPLLTMIGATTLALQTRQRLHGPLDWLLIEVLGALGLVATVVSFQLLRTRPSPPLGVDIDKTGHRRFYSMLERRLQHFANPPPGAVKLTMTAEIRAVATPRWPLPLFHTRTLCLGAPLMFLMSESGFRLALAGTVAASARSTGSLRGWIIQASMDWPSIVEALERRPSLAAKLMLPPARWFMRAAGSLNRDLRAHQQTVQSRWILENSGENAVSEFLATRLVADAFVSRMYWPMILKAAERCPTPVVHPFSHFEIFVKKTLTIEAARRWVLQAQAAGVNASDSALTELLAELNLDTLLWPGLPPRNAFDAVFGDSALLRKLDALWRLHIAEHWDQRYTRFQKQKSRFEQLRHKSHQHVLRGDSAINYVKLAARFLEAEEAMAVYRTMYANNLDSAALSFVCGEYMVTAGHIQEGIEALKHAAELDSALTNRVLAIISAHGQTAASRRPIQADIARIA